MRPPVNYYGSKVGLAPFIAGLLPRHTAYVEPFAGSAAVLFAKSPAPHEVLNDLDGHVARFFRVLRDRPAELERACRLSPYSREEYRGASLDDPDVTDELELARRFFVRCNQSFNGVGSSGARSGAWSAGIRQGKSQAAVAADRANELERAAERLRRVMVDNRDYEHILDLYDGPTTTFYVDPPYLGSTRSSLGPGGRRARDYSHDLTKPEEHVALAERLHALAGVVVLSGYPSDLYEELFADWDRTEVDVHRPSGNRRGESGGRATEVLWSNRPLAVQGALELEAPGIALADG